VSLLACKTVFSPEYRPVYLYRDVSLAVPKHPAAVCLDNGFAPVLIFFTTLITLLPNHIYSPHVNFKFFSTALCRVLFYFCRLSPRCHSHSFMFPPICNSFHFSSVIHLFSVKVVMLLLILQEDMQNAHLWHLYIPFSNLLSIIGHSFQVSYSFLPAVVTREMYYAILPLPPPSSAQDQWVVHMSLHSYVQSL
jgi:hypothetical protein